MRLHLMPVVICLMLVIQATAQSYPVKATYAYKQKVAPGKNDAFKKQRTQQTQHFIYLELQPDQFISVASLWINGQQYTFDTASVVTPVLIDESIQFPGKRNTVELVPATSNKVLNIHSLQPIEKGRKQPSYLKKYEVLIGYISGNKTYYVGSKLQELQPKLMK